MGSGGGDSSGLLNFGRLIVFRSVKPRPHNGTNDSSGNPDTEKRKERFYATIKVESLEQENCHKESGQKSEGESAASPMSSSRNHRNPHSGPRTGGSRLSGLELSAANHLVVSTERTVFRVCHPQPLVASS